MCWVMARGACSLGFSSEGPRRRGLAARALRPIELSVRRTARLAPAFGRQSRSRVRDRRQGRRLRAAPPSACAGFVAADGARDLLGDRDAESRRAGGVILANGHLQFEQASLARQTARRGAQKFAPPPQSSRRGGFWRRRAGDVRHHLIRPPGVEKVCAPSLGGKALAAAGASRRDDLAPADSRDAGAKPVATLAHDLAGLICSLHRCSPLATRTKYLFSFLFSQV